MRFSLLGPIVVADSAGERATPTGPRLRVLLAALLLHANTPVPAEALVEIVWDGSPPPAALGTLRSYVRRLRQALGVDAARIVARGTGYLISVHRSELDTLEFEALCREAREALRAGVWADAFAVGGRALGLWRTTPLLDLPAEALRGEFVPRFERLRLQVLEDRVDAGLRLGEHRELIPELMEATAQHPMQERFHAKLMLALAGAGRRSQALATYQEARRVLIGELGVEPGPEMREIHKRILAGDVPEASETAGRIRPGAIADADATGAAAGVDPSRAPAGSTGSALPCPAQLPADIADFTGREAQVADVCDALTRRETAGSRGTVRVVVVAGTAGVGKSALALHAAHQLRDLFPEGQLYANLSGSSAAPAVPGEVLARFLRDLGVDGGSVPKGEEEQAALYRTRLADRRVLIVLDDAKDATQIRPLLPGSASCAVVVTTRNRTPYLVGNGFVDLDAMPDPESLELFSRIAGSDRAAAEPDATAEITAACAGLPLAIRICAARLATRRQWKIGTMAARLREERHRLDELQAGDLEVRASFRISYDSLRAGRGLVDPARAFRLLSLCLGRQISLPAAAAVAGEREQDMIVALETLVDANLLQAPEPNSYQFHDLLRLFAAEQVRAVETGEERHTAQERLLRWYLETAVAAADVLSPNRYRIPGQTRLLTAAPSSVKDALAWYDREHECMIAAIRQAAEAGLHDLAWRLATALAPFFFRRGDWADCVAAHRIAVDSARAAGCRQGEAWALQNLGQGFVRLGKTEALACLEEALAIRREMADLAGEAQTLVSVAHAHYQLNGPQEAYDYSRRSLDMLRRAGNPGLLGTGLNNHGEFCLDLGRLDEATESLQEALSVLTAVDGHLFGYVLENIGRIHLESNRLSEAVASLTEAHHRYQANGHLKGQAMALKHLAEAHHAAGHHDQAHESLVAALALFERLNEDKEAEAIRSTLSVISTTVSDL